MKLLLELCCSCAVLMYLQLRIDRHRELIDNLRSGDATKDENDEFQELQRRGSYEILDFDLNKLFDIRDVKTELPPKAQIEPSKTCDLCGEPTMASMLQETEHGRFSWACASRDPPEQSESRRGRSSEPPVNTDAPRERNFGIMSL